MLVNMIYYMALGISILIVIILQLYVSSALSLLFLSLIFSIFLYFSSKIMNPILEEKRTFKTFKNLSKNKLFKFGLTTLLLINFIYWIFYNSIPDQIYFLSIIIYLLNFLVYLYSLIISIKTDKYVD
jgi:hypothetical protein